MGIFDKFKKNGKGVTFLAKTLLPFLPKSHKMIVVR